MATDDMDFLIVGQNDKKTEKHNRQIYLFDTSLNTNSKQLIIVQYIWISTTIQLTC